MSPSLYTAITALAAVRTINAASTAADLDQQVYDLFQSVHDMVTPAVDDAPTDRVDIFSMLGSVGINATEQVLNSKPIPLETYTDFNICQIDNTVGRDCNLAYLRANQQGKKGWIVKPDPSSTKAICNDGTPYAFQVFPGSTDNIMFWFQGGGGCFNYETCRMVPTATLNFRPEGYGIFDMANPNNPVAGGGWSIIVNNYCSGDLFVGNATVESASIMNVGESATLHFKGAENTLEVLSYYERHVASLEPTTAGTHRLTVAGCSAGSLASQFWNYRLLHKYNAERTLLDSYIGMLPAQLGEFVMDTGACQVGRDHLGWSAAQVSLCQTGTLHDLEEQVYGPFLQGSNNYPSGYIGSFHDQVQKTFYVLTSSDDYTGGIAPFMTAFGYSSGQFTPTLFNTLDQYKAVDPASSYYLVNSAGHCFLPLPALYDPTVTTAPNSPQQTMLQYVDTFLNRPTEAAITPLYTAEDKQGLTK